MPEAAAPAARPAVVAVVHETDALWRADGEQPAAFPPEARIGGLTLLRRAVLACWRAGAQRAYVVAETPESAARWAASEVNLPLPVEVVPPGGARPWETADVVLATSAQWVLAPEGWRRLLGEAEGRAPVCAIAVSWGMQGPWVATPGGLWPPDRTDPSRDCSTRLVHLSDAECRRVDSDADLRAADASLYQGLTSITDGWVDRVFNRRISGWFTRRIIDLPITPNHVTWFHFSLGLLAAWLFWQGGYWPGVLGAVLLQLSVALDCSDGEVARIKFQYSKFGSWLDVITDNIVTVACFAAIAKAAALRLGTGTALALGGAAVAGVLCCVAVIFGMGRLQARRRPGEASGLAATNRLSDADQAKAATDSLTDRVINEATSRDFSVLIVFFALIGRLEWFAWLAGVGSHVFWVVFGAIQWRRLRR
jgi:phosphatidylglycerophosphate synthase